MDNIKTNEPIVKKETIVQPVKKEEPKKEEVKKEKVSIVDLVKQ
jgi:hypothetical protein